MTKQGISTDLAGPFAAQARAAFYVEYFGTENLPARTTIPVALDGFDIEIDAVLCLP